LCNLYCNIYVIISVNYTVSIFISPFSDTCSTTLYSRLSSSFLVMRIFTPLLSYISLKHKIIRFIHSGTSITSSVFFHTPFITLSFSLFLSPPRPPYSYYHTYLIHVQYAAHNSSTIKQ
jgi:hypothetical protein